MNASAANVVLAESRLPGSAFAELDKAEIASGPLHAYVGNTRPEIGALIAVGDTVDRSLLDRLPGLRVVARFGVGYDAIDVAECSRRGVQVAVTPGLIEIAVVELTIGMMLALLLRVRQNDADVRRGNWAAPLCVMPEAQSAYGSALGLVGFGRIGRHVASRAVALGMHVRYTDRRPVGADVGDSLGAERQSLDDLLAVSDVVSVHVPLSHETRGLLGRAELARMRSGCIVLNTSRGAIIDERALIAEVTSGRLHAGLDVFWDEPNVPQALRACENVLLSPHAGSATALVREQMTRVCVDNVLAALAGNRAMYLVREQHGLFR